LAKKWERGRELGTNDAMAIQVALALGDTLTRRRHPEEPLKSCHESCIGSLENSRERTTLLLLPPPIPQEVDEVTFRRRSNQ